MCNSNKADKNNEEDIKLELYKLLRKYWTDERQQQIIKQYTKDSTGSTKNIVHELVSVSYLFFLSRDMLKKYDKERSRFGRFVYAVVDYNRTQFIYQAIYGLDWTRANALCRCNLNKDSEKGNEKFMKMFNAIIPLSLDKKQFFFDDVEEDFYSNLSTTNCVIGKKDVGVEEELEQKEFIKKIFDDLDNKHKYTDSQRKVIKTYIDKDFKQTEVAKSLNMSRQRVSVIINDFRDNLRKEIKE